MITRARTSKQTITESLHPDPQAEKNESGADVGPPPVTDFSNKATPLMHPQRFNQLGPRTQVYEPMRSFSLKPPHCDSAKYIFSGHSIAKYAIPKMI